MTHKEFIELDQFLQTPFALQKVYARRSPTHDAIEIRIVKVDSEDSTDFDKMSYFVFTVPMTGVSDG